jgi:hypothetical protein
MIYITLHLPGELPVYFKADAGTIGLEEMMASSFPTLIAFFKYNESNQDDIQYLY